MKFVVAQKKDGEVLAELRVLAMQESLEAIGRFDRERARERFLSSYCPETTRKVLLDDVLVGFFVVSEYPSYLYIDHLYIHPEHQNKQLGSRVLANIIDRSARDKKRIKLGALKGSRSNDFYVSQGFVKIDEGEHDNYYERKHS